MPDAALLRRLRVLIALRVVVVTALLGTFLFFRIGSAVFPYPESIFYLIVLLYALTIIFATWLTRLPPQAQAYIQLITDALWSVTLIFMTGGIESWFSWLMLLIVMAAAMVSGRRAAYILATVMAILYGVFMDLQYYNVLPVPYFTPFMERDFLYKIFSHILGLYLMAYFTGSLAARLEKQDIDYRQLARFNRAVIEGVPSGLFTTDMAGTVLIFNRAAEEITGVRREEAEGRHIGRIFPFLNSLPAQQNRGEKSVAFSTGNKIIGYSMRAMRGGPQESGGYIGIFQDLTEIKALSEEIKRKESLAAAGALSARIAHEIRNPLASLKGSIEMLREGGMEPARKERLMNIALSEMDRLNRTITDFLQFAKPAPAAYEEFDLHAALDETLQMLMARNDRMASIERDFAYEDMTVVADRGRLREVFWNLGINALEAMPSGGELMVSTRAGGGFVKVEFRDTGPGIRDDEIRRIFFPFYTTKPTGTGLGLSTAYRVAEDHGGSLAASNSPRGGAVFTLTIPRNPDGEKKNPDTDS